MRYLLFLFILFSFSAKATGVSYKEILRQIKAEARTVQVVNVNCDKACTQVNVVICDTIALNDDGHYSETVELPLKTLSAQDAALLVGKLTDKATYEDTHTVKGVKYEQGDCNCVTNATIAVLFRDKASVVFAQIIVNTDHYGYDIYYLKDGIYKRGVDDRYTGYQDYIHVSDWHNAYTIMLGIFKKYKLNCLDRQSERLRHKH